ncbi:MAG: FG-GAP-like repeat-containing protein [Bacteroidota bacterium]
MNPLSTKGPWRWLLLCFISVFLAFNSPNESAPGQMMSVSFSNQNALLTNSNFHSGVAMGIVDMNADGLDDIIRLNDARILNIEYQQADGSFSNFNYGTLSNRNEWSMCIADVDQNGYNDILVGGAYNDIRLLKANANGSNYSSSTLPNSSIFLQGANFVDIDNDGWVDIFACHDDAESRDYRNLQNGNFVFDDALINTNLPSGNSGNYASIWTDYDNDGDLDMYLSKCRQGVTSSADPRRINLLFQNDGNNNFTEVGAAAGLRYGDQTWSADFADIDNDGDMDCFMLNHYTPSLLLENNGDGTFTDITASSGLAPFLDLFGIQGLFSDFDNDGFVDLIVTGTEHRLFFNNGDGTFRNQSNPFTADQIESVAIGDLNHDGFPDIYAGYANLFNSPTSKDDILFMNSANSNNFLAVNLLGLSSNINGIGARLELHGTWGIQIREMRSGEGYGIMNSLTKTFGIGSASSIEKLVIKWPSGTIDELRNPSINSFLTITEGSFPIQQDQTITFSPLANRLTTDAPFDLSATASSGLPINFEILSGPASLNGNTLTLDGTPGTVLIEATQPGNGQYNPAPPISRSFTITIPNTSDCNNLINLALNKPASQSGTQQGASADRANDGNTSGNFWLDQSVSLTSWTDNAWWELDLLRLSQIESIHIWNRTDANMEFLSGFYVLVSDEPFSSTDLNTSLNQTGVEAYYQSEEAVLPSTIAINRTGRYIRIQMDRMVFLGLAEVEVMGCLATNGGVIDQQISFDALPDKLTTDAPFLLTATASSGLPVSYAILSGPASVAGNILTLDGTPGMVLIEASQSGDAQYNPAPSIRQSFDVTQAGGGACPNAQNLALNKLATQSSTQQSADAERANDGNTSGNFWMDFSVSLTNWESEPWWEIDLEVLSDIETIAIWNRTDVNMEYLKDYYVLVSDEPFASTNLLSTINQPGVSSYWQNTEAGTPTNIPINRSGRYVRIQMDGTNFLGLAEVEIIGCPGGSGGPYDQSITFESIGDLLTTDGPIVLSATASSALPVSFDLISGPASLTGNLLTLNGSPGTVLVEATQAGDALFNPAVAVRQSFEVSEPIPGLCLELENLALDRPSNQSGTQQGATADRANDGNTSGNFWRDQSVSLTTWATESWWEVDLEADSYIENIQIWNRTDVNMDFLENYYVLVSDTPFESTDLSTTLNQTGVDAYFESTVAEAPTNIAINRTGRYVRVQIQGTSFLGLAEVEVFGCAASSQENVTFDPMLHLEVQQSSGISALTWVANENTEGSRFIIERSFDKQYFEAIGEVNALGDDNPQHRRYEHEDAWPQMGDNYYRIRQIEASGRERLSQVRQLRFEGNPLDFAVFPNPSNGRVFVNLAKYLGQSGQLAIYNSIGVPILQQELSALDQAIIALDMTKVENGWYLITVKIAGQPRQTLPLIIERLY